MSKGIKELCCIKGGYKPFDNFMPYPDGEYCVIRYSPLSGNIYYTEDEVVDGKFKLGILGGSVRILIKKVGDNTLSDIFMSNDFGFTQENEMPSMSAV